MATETKVAPKAPAKNGQAKKEKKEVTLSPVKNAVRVYSMAALEIGKKNGFEGVVNSGNEGKRIDNTTEDGKKALRLAVQKVQSKVTPQGFVMREEENSTYFTDVKKALNAAKDSIKAKDYSPSVKAFLELISAKPSKVSSGRLVTAEQLEELSGLLS